MAQMMDIPILGIVENMSWFRCDKCGEKHFIYGKSRLEEAAAQYGLGAARTIWFVQHQNRASVAYIDGHAGLLRREQHPAIDTFPFYKVRP